MREEYVSTGEAANILNISRSTVSRRFDAGMLQGKMNPITGERLISRQSIQELIKKHNLPVEAPGGGRGIVLATSDMALAEAVRRMAAADDRLEVNIVNQGSDALITCANSVPDLLILDEQLPDIRGSHVVKSLRKCAQMKHTKILVCGAGVDPETAIKWGANDGLSTNRAENLNRLNDLVYRLIGLTSEALAKTGAHEHMRTSPRFNVDIASQLAVSPYSQPGKMSWGKATIRNISRGGAYLSGITLDNTSFPGEPFKMLLQTDSAPLKNWQADCQVVRLQSNGSLSAGVMFKEISDENRNKIAELQFI